MKSWKPSGRRREGDNERCACMRQSGDGSALMLTSVRRAGSVGGGSVDVQ